MKIKQSTLMKILAILFLLATFYFVKIQMYYYSQDGRQVCGTILQANPPQGRLTSYQVLVDWDEYGREVIDGGTVFPYQKGERYCTTLQYCFPLGIAGLAYIPDEAGSTFLHFLFSFIMILIYVGLILFAIVCIISSIKIVKE